MNARLARTAVRWALGLSLLAQGLLTALHAGEGAVVTLIAAVESVAAALLLWPRAAVVGGVGLFFALGAAVAVHLLRGHGPGALPAYMLVVILLLAEPRP